MPIRTPRKGLAQAGDLIVLEAKLEGLQNDLEDLRKKQWSGLKRCRL